MTTDSRLQPGERVLAEVKKVSFLLKSSCPTAPLQSSTEGSIILTNTKFELLWPPSGHLWLPLNCIRGVQVQQPIFGANYIDVAVQAPAGAGWEGPGNVTISFQSGGCIEFSRALVRLSQGHVPAPDNETADQDDSRTTPDDKKNK
ncbi:postacrosomal sheath WW domain-binding protein-like [Dysidea avara]|uniref:postacrosomal sheath WW domain-binding protein-like n=1 Tax=Dysidea avara TaxID=196820 RepID=UPI00332B1792